MILMIRDIMRLRRELPLERSHWSVIDTSNDLHNRDVARLSTWIIRSFGGRSRKVPKPWWLLLGGYWLEKRTLRRWQNMITWGGGRVYSPSSHQREVCTWRFWPRLSGRRKRFRTNNPEKRFSVLACPYSVCRFVVLLGQLEFGSGCRIRYSRQRVRSDCGS